jgi:uncharacterized membrane protein
MSDLIVIGYPDEATAEEVWHELVKLQEDFLVDLEDAAIVRRDRTISGSGSRTWCSPGRQRSWSSCAR